MTNNELNTPIREQLKAGLAKAMKARQTSVISALRTILSEIDNAEAVEFTASAVPVVGLSKDVPRKILSEVEMRSILKREYHGIKQSLKEYQRLEKHEEAGQLQAELEALASYLKDSEK